MVMPVGGLAEQVLCEQTGIVATAVTLPAIAEALTRLVDDEELRLRCADGAPKHAAEVPGWSPLAAQSSLILRTVTRLRPSERA